MTKEVDLTKILANNLIFYRKAAGMTQLQIAEKFNYSDKAVSKWERAESTPDIFILKSLADFYGIQLSDFFVEKKTAYLASSWKKHLIITLLSFVLVWFVAAIVFVLGEMSHFSERMWLVWIFATVPASIVLIVFSAIWGNRIHSILSISLLTWSVATSVFVPLQIFQTVDNAYLVFIVAGIFQVMVGLWYFLKVPEYIKKRFKIKSKEVKDEEKEDSKK